MAPGLQLDRVMEFLEDSRQSLRAELDFHHLVMLQSIDAVCSPQMVERLLENPSQQQQMVESLLENEQQPSQQQQMKQQQERVWDPEQKQEEEEEEQPQALLVPQEPLQIPQEPLQLEAQKSSARPSALFSDWSVGSNSTRGSVHKDSKTASKYENSKKLKLKMEQVKGLVGRKSMKNKEQSPLRKRIGQWLDSVLDKVIGCLVIANVVVIFAYLQFQGAETNKSLGLKSESWEHAKIIFDVFDHFFCIVFSVELILRMYVDGIAYFKSFFNIVDAVVVPMMILNICLQDMENKKLDLSFVRSFRVLRIICAFRVVRTVSHFQHLRILWNTIAGSMGSFFYSMAIMFVVMLVLAILLAQTLHEFIVDEGKDLVTRQWANRYFGDGFKSLWTVFEFTFSGCWPTFVRPLVEEVHWLYAPLFALYVTSVIFAMTRVISALFLKETISQAALDTEMMVRERTKATKNMEKNLVALFHTADSDGDGLLTEEEFAEILSNEKIKMWLGMMGVDGTDAHELFHTLCGDHVGGLPCDSFVYSVKRVRGEARAQDLIPVVNDCKHILRICERTLASFQQLELKVNGEPCYGFRDNATFGGNLYSKSLVL